MKILRNTIISDIPPKDTLVLWLKPENNTYTLNVYGNKGWLSISGAVELEPTKPSIPINEKNIIEFEWETVNGEPLIITTAQGFENHQPINPDVIEFTKSPAYIRITDDIQSFSFSTALYSYYTPYLNGYLTKLNITKWNIERPLDLTLFLSGLLYLEDLQFNIKNKILCNELTLAFSGSRSLNNINLGIFKCVPPYNDGRPSYIWAEWIFKYCRNITSIDFGKDFDALSMSFSNVFSELRYYHEPNTIDLEGNIINIYDGDLWLGPFPPLTKKAILVIINSLHNYGTTTSRHNVYLTSLQESSLTPEEIAIVTDKGWTIVIKN